MKKKILILLSVILVVALATTGVFADTLSAYPSGPFDFTQVVKAHYFYKLVGSDVTSTPVYLFNGFYAVRDDSSTIHFVLNGVSSTTYALDDSSSFNISFALSGTSGYLQFSRGNPYFNESTYGTNTTVKINGADVTLSMLGISYGDSVLGSPHVSSSVSTFHLSLPYGNAMRIYSESAFTITARSYTVRDTTYNFQKYVRASDNFSYRVNGTYQGVVLNSSLVGNIGLSVYGSDNVISLLVPWQPTNQNILGRATAYNYYSAIPDPTSSVSVGSGESFLIWYPYYANNQDTSKLNEVPMDMAITIEYTSPVFFMTYPITGNPSSGEDIYISNTSNVSNSGGSQQSDDGEGNITVTFDNAPTAGGNHGQASINQNNSILGVLSNLQNTLLGLFNKAIDGIHNLISLGSSFLQSVQIMFSWLPSELLVIITSGFVILLTIGVLKTLWR